MGTLLKDATPFSVKSRRSPQVNHPCLALDVGSMFQGLVTVAIPDFQTIMLPLMQMASDGREYSLREAIEKLAHQFQLSDQERQEMLPSGHQATFDNRVGWAKTHLKKAGLLQATRRGYFQITPRGQVILDSNTDRIDGKLLEQFPEYIAFRMLNREPISSHPIDPVSPAKTPEENPESIVQGLTQDLASELLENIKAWGISLSRDRLTVPGIGLL